MDPNLFNIILDLLFMAFVITAAYIIREKYCKDK